MQVPGGNFFEREAVKMWDGSPSLRWIWRKIEEYFGFHVYFKCSVSLWTSSFNEALFWPKKIESAAGERELRLGEFIESDARQKPGAFPDNTWIEGELRDDGSSLRDDLEGVLIWGDNSLLLNDRLGFFGGLWESDDRERRAGFGLQNYAERLKFCSEANGRKTGQFPERLQASELFQETFQRASGNSEDKIIVLCARPTEVPRILCQGKQVPLSRGQSGFWSDEDGSPKIFAPEFSLILAEAGHLSESCRRTWGAAETEDCARRPEAPKYSDRRVG